MDWGALLGGLIGAGIPALLTYLGLHRARQSADAETFGPAVLLLDRLNPERVTLNLNPNATVEAGKWAEMQRQLEVARERLLVISAGHPRRRIRRLAKDAEVKLARAFSAAHWTIRDMQANRDNREWLDQARGTHSEAAAAMTELIEANFAWCPAFSRHGVRRQEIPQR